MVDLKAISEQLQKGKAAEVERLVKEAIAQKVDVEKILNEGLVAGMSVIGAKFKKNEVYVPEVLIAARAMNAGMKILEPLLVAAGVELAGRIVIGTVKGDLHDIGKNLVGMMLKGGGFEVIDLGIDVDAQKFVSAAKEKKAKIIALSALLTTTMPQMAGVIKALKDSGMKNVKVMIGGAPLTQSYADEIGADGYAPDAASAVDLAKSLMA